MSESAKLFHWTTADRLNSILEQGLKTGSRNNLTLNGDWSFEVYGCRPIFLSFDADLPYKDHSDVLLEIDVAEIDLVADIPSLVSKGAYYDVDADEMWWKDSDEILCLSSLARPSEDTEKAISMTRTAASLENIPPMKIKVVRAPIMNIESVSVSPNSRDDSPSQKMQRKIK
jgi:hypothetical protein